MDMKRVSRRLAMLLCSLILGGLISATFPVWAQAPPVPAAPLPPAAPPAPEPGKSEGLRAESSNAPAELVFPSYGSGPIEVRLYTNYFCGPCRAMEPEIEPLLKGLVKSNKVRLLLVDFPFDERTNLFSRYFLYAIKANNDLDHALRVRAILLEASTNDTITQKKHIEALFKKEGIPFTVTDVGPILNSYDALIQDGNVTRTPTCVVIKEGRKRKFSGGANILYALNVLQ